MKRSRADVAGVQTTTWSQSAAVHLTMKATRAPSAERSAIGVPVAIVFGATTRSLGRSGGAGAPAGAARVHPTNSNPPTILVTRRKPRPFAPTIQIWLVSTIRPCPSGVHVSALIVGPHAAEAQPPQPATIHADDAEVSLAPTGKASRRPSRDHEYGKAEPCATRCRPVPFGRTT